MFLFLVAIFQIFTMFQFRLSSPQGNRILLYRITISAYMLPHNPSNDLRLSIFGNEEPSTQFPLQNSRQKLRQSSEVFLYSSILFDIFTLLQRIYLFRGVSTGGTRPPPPPHPPSPNNFSDFCFAKCNKTCSAPHLCCHLHLPRQLIMVDL